MTVKALVLPDTIRLGMTGGPNFMTEIVTLESGHEQRNIGMASPLRTYTVEYVRNVAELKSLHALFMNVRGAAYGFLLKDPFDFEVESTEGLLGTGVGTGMPTYQLKKRYAYGAETFDRNVTRPIAGTYTIYRGGSPVTIGTSPQPAGSIAVDEATGIVTFTADATVSISGHTVGSSHQFTTATDIASLIVGEKVFLSGITGSAASLLNGIAHTISNKTGSGPYTWTISTNTGGSPTLTASGGTAYEYPQASATLTWEGQYYVPVRFTSDQFQARIVGKNYYEVDGLGLKEIRE